MHPAARSISALLPVALALLSQPALAQTGSTDTIILDDYDADDSDELLGNQGLIALVDGSDTPFPFLDQDETFQTPGDIGATRFSVELGTQILVVGQYPNDAGAGVELGLDFTAMRVIGFEMEFRNVAAEFPFGLTIFDGGPSGTPARKIAVVDAAIPAGDFIYRTLFTDPEWNIEPGFEFNDIGSIYYGINSLPRTPNGIQPVDVTGADLVEFRAIVDTCLADINLSGTVDFFDVADFIALYSSDDPAADIAEPIGTLNFFDIAAFITLFNAGCP